MCGIVGYTGSRPAAPILLAGLSHLEYRGYDSAGLAVREGGGEIEIVKTRGRLRALSHGIVQDMQTAEECENDTYLQAWNAIPPHDPKEYLYDAYYVPAIADACLENMPVYDGRFN